MAHKYLHTSMYGSYYVKCKILYQIPFDVKKHGEGLERTLFLTMGIIPKKQGQLGYMIKYEDPHYNERVKCWVPLHKVQLNVQHIPSRWPPSRPCGDSNV